MQTTGKEVNKAKISQPSRWTCPTCEAGVLSLIVKAARGREYGWCGRCDNAWPATWPCLCPRQGDLWLCAARPVWCDGTVGGVVPAGHWCDLARSGVC